MFIRTVLEVWEILFLFLLWLGNLASETVVIGIRWRGGTKRAALNGIFSKQVDNLFWKYALLCLSCFLLYITVFLLLTYTRLPLLPSRVWLLNKWKKTFYNIKGRLFRKGKPCWGVEEACLLTLDTSYLRQFQMDPPLGNSCSVPRGVQEGSHLDVDQGLLWKDITVCFHFLQSFFPLSSERLPVTEPFAHKQKL